MKPQVNPFTNRAMITGPGDFFGRRREIEQLLGRVLGGSKVQSCALVGQRRIGKSSLLRRLLALIPERDPRAVAAYYDLEAGRKLTVEKFHATLLKRLARAAGVALPADGAGGDAYEALVEFLERHEGERRFVLLLDEFDTVTSNPHFDADFFGSLRYLANNHELAFLTSSYRDLTELCHAEEVRQSPFFNVFTNLDLKLMAPPEIEEMLAVLSERGGRPFDPARRERILELGGHYPFFAQIAAAALWEIENETGEAPRPALEARFREEAWPHFRYFVEHLGSAEQQALGALARGEGAQPASLRRLVRLSLVVETAAGGVGPFSPWFFEYVREAGGLQGGAQATVATPGAALAAPPGEAAPGTLLGGRYELGRRLGAGAFGTVFAARDRVLGREVAVKLLRLDEARFPNEREERQKRFLREAEALARMKHPNVITVFDLGEWEGRHFLVMELVEGGTLADLLVRKGRLTEAETASVARQAALGLAHAHSLGVVHRDVKPANLMLEPSGRVRVGDFGILRYRSADPATGGEALTWDGRAVGTPAYMAPEQLRPGGDVDARTDLYALGVVLYECVTGKRPFASGELSGIVWHVLFSEPPDPRRQAPGVSEDWVLLVRKAMAKEAAARFPSGEEMARALEPFVRE